MSKTSISPMRHMAVLAIANRLGANQAPGDMAERVARVWRVDRQRSRIRKYTTDIDPVRSARVRYGDTTMINLMIWLVARGVIG